MITNDFDQISLNYKYLKSLKQIVFRHYIVRRLQSNRLEK